MKNYLYVLLAMATWGSSCSNNPPKPSAKIHNPAEHKEAHSHITEPKTVGKPSISKDSFEQAHEALLLNFKHISLGEHSLNSFDLPFAEKDMLTELADYYQPYQVERKTGQQDGPGFEYIDIRNQDKTLLFINFDADNPYRIDQIRIQDSSVADTFGIRIGDSYQDLKNKRPTTFRNVTDYHQHTYLYPEGSNIFYEIGGYDLTLDMLDNIEEVVLTERQLENCKVVAIIWKNSK